MRTTYSKRLVIVSVAVLSLLGCGGDVSSPASFEVARQALTARNGANLNGSNLNGSNLNGNALSQTLVAVAYAGARLGEEGDALDGVWLQGTVFHGLQGAQGFSGLDFSQARFQGTLGNGVRVWLRVEAVTPSTGADGDVWTYRVSYQEPADARWYPICKGASGEALEAIPVAGRWDYRQGVPGGGAKLEDAAAFTFGCEGAAIAKCVRFGYKPWASVNGVSLAGHHQACTRLVRADFCGDGASYTVDGQWVNVFDGLGVQQDSEAWHLEAEWDTAGARCFSSENRSQTNVSCYDARKASSCGQPGHFSSGTLMMSETPTGP